MFLIDGDPDPKARGPPETLHEGQIEGGGGDGGEPAGAQQVGRHRADRIISDRPCPLPFGATRLERRARSTR